MIHDNIPSTRTKYRSMTVCAEFHERLIKYIQKYHTSVDGALLTCLEEKQETIAFARKIKVIPKTIQVYYP